jgi:hypothetical protein
MSTAINGTDKDEIFRTERFDHAEGEEMKYEIPLQDGNYDVYLYFAETFSKAQDPGLRLFNVWLEKTLIFEKVDVFSEAGGGFIPLSKRWTTAVVDGGLTIEFGHVVQNPAIKGIEIRPADIKGAPPIILHIPTQPPQRSQVRLCQLHRL